MPHIENRPRYLSSLIYVSSHTLRIVSYRFVYVGGVGGGAGHAAVDGWAAMQMERTKVQPGMFL
jgi:hypothetical protein